MEDPDSRALIPSAAGLLEADVAAARRFIEASRSAATRRAYAADWRIYEAWCASRGLEAIPSPPAQVAMFLAAEAGRREVSTIGRRLAAIGYVHRAAGHPAPTAMPGAVVIEETMAGIRRTFGAAPEKKKALVAADIRRIVEAIGTATQRDRRDRALLALGFGSAMRRSELAALEVGHLERRPQGILILIPRSKGDQEGEGRRIAVPNGAELRPVALLEEWLEGAGIARGSVFRRVSTSDRVLLDGIGGHTIAAVVKARAAAVGFDAVAIAAHSLRSGFLTTAAHARASVFKLKEVSRHASFDTLMGYVQEAGLFDDHAGEDFL